MALLNLGSSAPNLRTAAYNQLCALTATFDLKIEGQLLETQGKLSLPSSQTYFDINKLPKWDPRGTPDIFIRYKMFIFENLNSVH